MEITVCNIIGEKLTSEGEEARNYQKLRKKIRKVSLSLYLLSNWIFVAEGKDTQTFHLCTLQLQLCHGS